MNEVNNQIDVEKVKKGVSPGIVFLLVIIFGAIFGVGGWFLGTKLANKEDNNHFAIHLSFFYYYIKILFIINCCI